MNILKTYALVFSTTTIECVYEFYTEITFNKAIHDALHDVVIKNDEDFIFLRD